MVVLDLSDVTFEEMRELARAAERAGVVSPPDHEMTDAECQEWFIDNYSALQRMQAILRRSEQ
jgi:hypothetical protein